MSELFDNITRIVGSPVPRRQALKAIGGALLGAVFAGSAYRKTHAAQENRCCQGDEGACLIPGATVCDPLFGWNEIVCMGQNGQWVPGGVCCTESVACQANETCCGWVCCPAGWSCLGTGCCPPERLYNQGTECCPEGTVPTNNRTVCCPAANVMPNDQCCGDGNVIAGGVCCPPWQVCGNPAVCCPWPDYSCVNGACCLMTRVCTGVNNVTVCCPSGRCCGGKCCPGGCTPDGLNCAVNVVSGARM